MPIDCNAMTDRVETGSAMMLQSPIHQRVTRPSSDCDGLGLQIRRKQVSVQHEMVGPLRLSRENLQASGKKSRIRMTVYA